jgi:hypothetical protein
MSETRSGQVMIDGEHKNPKTRLSVFQQDRLHRFLRNSKKSTFCQNNIPIQQHRVRFNFFGRRHQFGDRRFFTRT